MILKKHNVEREVSECSMVEKLKKQGYEEVIEGKQETSLDKMKVADLKALACKKGIEGSEGLKKEELVEILKDVM